MKKPYGDHLHKLKIAMVLEPYEMPKITLDMFVLSESE